jgi:hypothetical protein
MAHRMSLLAIALGLSAASLACGGGTESVVGPSASAAPPASGAPGTGGAAGGVVRVQCEQSSGRSKISVDGNNLRAGMYQARVSSGANQMVAAPAATVGDEVEFDFDSNANDVTAGATRIASTFIQNGRVQGDLLDTAGALVASATATCSVR